MTTRECQRTERYDVKRMSENIGMTSKECQRTERYGVKRMSGNREAWGPGKIRD